MLDSIIIVLKSISGVIGRVNIDALDPAGEFRFQGFEGKEVVAENETVIEEILVAYPVFGVIGLLRVLE